MAGAEAKSTSAHTMQISQGDKRRIIHAKSIMVEKAHPSTRVRKVDMEEFNAESGAGAFDTGMGAMDKPGQKKRERGEAYSTARWCDVVV